MSVKVNLLPREYEERIRTRRTVGYTVAGVLLWCGVLAVVLALKAADVDRAREERDLALAQTAQLQSELVALDSYRLLAGRLESRSALLTDAMAPEVSWATLLNDLSLTFPTTSSLRSLTGTLDQPLPDAAPVPPAPAPTPAPTPPPTPAPVPAPAPGPLTEEAIGTIVFAGYSIEGYAPGVETAIVRFDDVESFSDSFLTQAGTEEIGDTPVTQFQGQVDVNGSARTNRYAEGLPPEVPQ
ncbi:MAG: hypothetical protein H0V05_00735 [Euzebyaceae bacterium]|nr:hypothetical protein [Euzebyaceae bacterium]